MRDVSHRGGSEREYCHKVCGADGNFFRDLQQEYECDYDQRAGNAGCADEKTKDDAKECRCYEFARCFAVSGLIVFGEKEFIRQGAYRQDNSGNDNILKINNAVDGLLLSCEKIGDRNRCYGKHQDGFEADIAVFIVLDCTADHHEDAGHADGTDGGKLIDTYQDQRRGADQAFADGSHADYETKEKAEKCDADNKRDCHIARLKGIRCKIHGSPTGLQAVQVQLAYPARYFQLIRGPCHDIRQGPAGCPSLSEQYIYR